MKIAIMQPYFLPYIGYFQLVAAVDAFVVYDNIKYTKKGWVNRNRMLQNSQDATFSVSLKKASDSLNIVERELSPDFDKTKLLNQFRGVYAKAPYFHDIFPHIETIVNYPANNLFDYLYHSLRQMAALLELETKFIISSSLPVDSTLKGQDKVLSICRVLDAQCYINAIGGRELYNKTEFAQQGISLSFIQSEMFEYPQYGSAFVPWLSIIDVLMFNSLDAVCHRVRHNYSLV